MSGCSKKAALGVLSSDCISSSAYATEEMLVQLVPYVGLAAFSLVLPITAVVLGVLVLVTLSYREVVMIYTKAGGSYVVARDNFGPNVAQISAVALLIDYTVTVAVQSAAGTAALTSAFPVLAPATVPLTVGLVCVLVYGNLRGIREAGRTFALPTYLFVTTVGAIVVAGVVRYLTVGLPVLNVHAPGAVSVGHSGSGLLMGASVVLVLKAFANGGSIAHRPGGHLQRRRGVSPTGGFQRPPHPGRHEHAPRVPGARRVPARPLDPRHSLMCPAAPR